MDSQKLKSTLIILFSWLSDLKSSAEVANSVENVAYKKSGLFGNSSGLQMAFLAQKNLATLIDQTTTAKKWVRGLA